MPNHGPHSMMDQQHRLRKTRGEITIDGFYERIQPPGELVRDIAELPAGTDPAAGRTLSQRLFLPNDNVMV